MKVLRWVLVVPAGIAAWYAVFILGLGVYGWLERRLCPPERWISGTCGDLTVLRILDGVEVFFIALSAVAVVSATAAVAPAERDVIAWAAFGVGAFTAVSLAIAGDVYVGGAAAVAAGLVTAMVIARSDKRRRARSAAP